MLSADVLMAIDRATRHGAPRLGMLRLQGKPVAAQLWIVTGGVARGIVLTDFMIAEVLDGEPVDAIDFGVGTEQAQRGWMKETRVSVGWLAFNPDTWRGRWQALCHIGGQPIKRWLKALRDHGGPPIKRPLKALLQRMGR